MDEYDQCWAPPDFSDFQIRAGDTAPALNWILLDQNGRRIDLTSATGVSFRMELPGVSPPAVNATAQVTAAQGGGVSYQWQPGDTAVPGNYFGQFVVTWPGPLTQTVPEGYPIRIRVTSP